MRGGFLHNVVLITALVLEWTKRGARTWREAAVHLGHTTGYIDLLVEIAGFRVAIEAELTPRRVANDIEKAIAVRAQELWVVVPDAQVARAIRRKLHLVPIAEGTPKIFVLTLGQAKQRVRNLVPFISGANVLKGKEKNKGRYST